MSGPFICGLKWLVATQPYGAVAPVETALPAPSHAVTWITPCWGTLLQFTFSPLRVVPSGQVHCAARSVPWPPMGVRLNWAFVLSRVETIALTVTEKGGWIVSVWAKERELPVVLSVTCAVTL